MHGVARSSSAQFASASHVPNPSNDASDLARFAERLPPLLSVIAGMVEAIAYLRLGNLFTAHVTGNIVVLAALLVRGEPLNAPQVMAVPVFIIAVAAIWLLAKASDRRGPALARPLLFVQLLLLVGAMILAVTSDIAASQMGFMADVAALFALSAMACQFALLSLAVPGAPSTAVMTGNLTNTVLSLLEKLSPNRPLMTPDDGRLGRTATLVVGFFVGSVAGAAAVFLLGNWSWSLPVALAGAAIALR